MLDDGEFILATISTSLSSNVTSPSPAFELCSLLRLIGCYLVILWVVGTLLNGIALYTLARKETLRRSSTNLLIGGLLFADLIGSCLELPLPAFSLLHCRWLFAYSGCVFEAILVYFAGCSNMYMLCLISIDRYGVVMSPSRNRKVNTRRIYLYIGGAYTLSLFWTMVPLLGWSTYDFEGIGVSCSIQWVGRSFNVISYNIAIFTFVYLIPVIIIVISNVKIHRAIQSRWRTARGSLDNRRAQQRCKIERRVLHTIILTIGSFLVAWTPYAIIVFIRICFNTNYFPPIVDTIPALFAKTSLVWNPMIYTLRNGNFRSHLPFTSAQYASSL